MGDSRCYLMGLVVSAILLPIARAGSLADLAQAHQGRSMRVTSTAKLDADGPYGPKGAPHPQSNRDNSNVQPGQTKLLMDVEGPGVITHIWMTFLAPEPHPWAAQGSANHQEMLLRIFWDNNERPGVEAPVGDFFANGFGKRSEVVSLPVVVEDADSYTASGTCPSARARAWRLSIRATSPSACSTTISTGSNTRA